MPAALLEAARAARAIAREGGKAHVQAWHARRPPPVPGRGPDRDGSATTTRSTLLQRIDRARAADPRVQQVMASVAAVHDIILVAAATATLAADVRPLVRLNVQVIVEHNGRREQGYAGGGGRYSLRRIHRRRQALKGSRAKPCARRLVNLEAVRRRRA